MSGDKLLADIIEANVRSTAWTTDKLIESVERQRNEIAGALAGLYDALDRIPPDSMSLTVSRLLDRYAAARDSSGRYLADGESC